MTSKITLQTARDLCDRAVQTAGGDYVCPTDKPGLIQTALSAADFDVDPSILNALSDKTFVETFLSDPILKEMLDQDALWYFQGADNADRGGSSWGESQIAGEKHYADCWEEFQATGMIQGLEDLFNGTADENSLVDTSAYDNFSV